MSVDAILQLGDRLQEHVDDSGCHLYLWVTNSHLVHGFRVMNRWGFAYKTTITWFKDRFGLASTSEDRPNTAFSVYGAACHIGHRGTVSARKESRPFVLLA